MAQPPPIDPLDEPISQFVVKVNEFLAIKAKVDPPPKKDGTGNFLQDLVQNWEEIKRHIRRSYEATVGVQPEVAQKLDDILSLGNRIKALTDDPFVVNPVDGVVIRVTEERTEIGNIIPTMANATSIPTVMSLMGELLGFGTRTVARRKEITELLTDLTAYYLLRLPPRESA